MAEGVMMEIGTRGLDHFDGHLNEEWHPDLAGREAMRVFREMEDNISVIGGYTAMTEFLGRQVTFRVDAANDSDEAKDERDRIEETLGDMATGLDVILSEIMSAPIYGWVAFEKVYKLRRGMDEEDERLRSKYDDGRIGIAELAIRPQETLSRWKFDDRGRWQGMYQRSPPSFIETFIPKRKLSHFVVRSRKGSPEGRSMLRSSARDYKFLKGHQEYESIGAQKNLAGVLYALLPPECFDEESDDPEVKKMVALKDTILDILAKFHRNEYATLGFPAEFVTGTKDERTGFGLKEFQGPARPFNSDPVIKRYEARILASLLAEFLIIGMDRHGSHSLGDSKTKLIAMVVGAIIGAYVDVMNEVIVELTMLNGRPATIAPKLRNNDIETPDLGQIANYLQVLLQHYEATVELARWSERTGGLPAGALGEPKTAPDPAPPVAAPTEPTAEPPEEEEEVQDDGDEEDDV